jgi:hypothetical protein
VITKPPKDYKKKQKDFFDQLAIKWNIKTPEDWTKISSIQVLNEKGGEFVNLFYNGSLQQGKEFVQYFRYILLRSCHCNETVLEINV